MKTVFVDRDGVINRRRINDWVKDWDEFEFLDGVPEALKLLKNEGFRLILITNQRCLALGLINRHQLDEIHNLMNQKINRDGGAAFDDIFVCPHDRHEKCGCRKPEPGMLLNAAEKYQDIVLGECVMFGDSDSDEQAAAAAGCKGFYRIDETNSLLDMVKRYIASS